MTDTVQQRRSWISRTHLEAASAALTFGVVLVLGVVTTQLAQAQTFTVLYTFTGGTDGGVSQAPLVRDAAGNLYGTTTVGGDLACEYDGVMPGCGTVFRLDPTGKETVLHSFTGAPDGADLVSGLTGDSTGHFYGTTRFGGGTGCSGSGCGVVFKVTKAGKETVLYTFTGGDDGDYPDSLIRDATGNLYGTTFLGGGTGCNVSGCGTVFKMTKAGKETVLYRFTGGDDGAYPGGLIRDAKGNLYGTAAGGGDMSDCDGSGCGVVFRLSQTGKETVLYRFTGGADGAYPGGLIRDAKGNLYGTAGGGDMSDCTGCGVVFKLAPNGKETVLHSFTGPPDGRIPEGLLRDSTGNLYGTTAEGGDSNCIEGGGCGTIFKVDPTGKETVLYTFTGSPDGELPLAVLIMDASGNLYGTTAFGGNPNSPCFDGTHITGCGVIFKLAP
jgi:uncharacterized repeat protein (TIGR03803 family)